MTLKDFLTLLPPHCTHSAIFSSGGSIWCSSDGWSFTEENGKMLAKLMEDPISASKSKFKLGQRTYLVIYADDQVLVARKREFGIYVAKCKAYYIIGFSDSTVNPTRCLESVKRIAELMKQNARQPQKAIPVPEKKDDDSLDTT